MYLIKTILLGIILCYSNLVYSQYSTAKKEYTKVQIPPAPVKGKEAFLQYCLKNSFKRRFAISDYLQCWKRVNFKVKKNGCLVFMNCSKCKTGAVKRSIKRTINQAPKWRPASHNKEAVTVEVAFGIGPDYMAEIRKIYQKYPFR
ncbi:hypothetical protein AAG747_27750 [Rapidithrix thailandica]|uniref:Uncharacterized protein n=1 Tax=Rapidithrix thailandica TaxID=413964 RepID=A0AAW9S3K0_9BACT